MFVFFHWPSLFPKAFSRLYECNIARDCKQGFAINKIVFFLNNLQFLLYKAEWVCSFQQRNNGSNMKAGLDSPLSVE